MTMIKQLQTAAKMNNFLFVKFRHGEAQKKI